MKNVHSTLLYLRFYWICDLFSKCLHYCPLEFARWQYISIFPYLSLRRGIKCKIWWLTWFLQFAAAWSEGRRCWKARQSFRLLNALCFGCLGSYMVCVGSYLHVAQRSNCSQRSANLSKRYWWLNLVILSSFLFKVSSKARTIKKHVSNIN